MPGRKSPGPSVKKKDTYEALRGSGDVDRDAPEADLVAEPDDQRSGKEPKDLRAPRQRTHGSSSSTRCAAR